MSNKYEPVIGLEVHIELSTKSKMFCRCSADYFGAEPNTHTCPICLGMPGAMPSANWQAIEFVHKLGLALNCHIPLSSKFDRKNYFYPDLAKGFQISQYDLPFSQKGYIEIDSLGPSGLQNDKREKKRIGITRAHLEEDTGKLAHAAVDGKRVTLIDFNRSSVPLVEVVTDPDMNSSEEAKAYAQKLQQIARYLKISDADMEKGSMRIEPNVSLRKVQKGTISTISTISTKGKIELPPYKVELKNINSFKFAQAAIEFEIKRQSEILDSGGIPVQETRGWNESKSQTVSQRSKEFAHDYRYFPEPDLIPFEFSQTDIDKMKLELPELPDAKFKRFQKDFQLSAYDSEILTREKETADFFEEAVKAGETVQISPKQVANYIINKKPDIKNELPAQFIQNLVKQTSTQSIRNDELSEIIDQVLEENPKAREDYTSGKGNALMFLVGQVMRKIGAKIDANNVKSMLEKKLKL